MPSLLARSFRSSRELAQRLSDVRVPTLLLYGAQDDIIAAGMALLVTRSVPGSKLILYQDHRHSLAGEAPERLVAEVLVFVREVQASETHLVR